MSAELLWSSFSDLRKSRERRDRTEMMEDAQEAGRKEGHSGGMSVLKVLSTDQEKGGAWRVCPALVAIKRKNHTSDPFDRSTSGIIWGEHSAGARLSRQRTFLGGREDTWRPVTDLDAQRGGEPRRVSKRERKRIKGVRRRQKRKERWRQSQLQAKILVIRWDSSDEDDEDVTKEGYVCAVCLDVYFSPYMCQPCKHIFCEPCLRTLAKNCPASTPCPLCRTIITHVFFQNELNQMARTFFPKEYLCRKQNFQKASCAKWPLPSCRKLFRIFGGFRRPSSPGGRHQLSRAGGGFRLNTLDFDDDARGWHFDMDMVIIYIYSVNWIVGFFIFCILCYLFFPSF
ncbi:E3 ubiquitin-protein ligase RNF180 [Syngnathoides biaculeatus]|uniref:E3 ubiquitin-protein ligase RNF180 n=1 Tax=Syngnathoides biaculeatus TaxID=300417 RepID=UPI002ADD608E|nr:E3 ubiquitin-protein ligase RNF180 [Syngnathoides biaculeatus]